MSANPLADLMGAAVADTNSFELNMDMDAENANPTTTTTAAAAPVKRSSNHAAAIAAAPAKTASRTTVVATSGGAAGLSAQFNSNPLGAMSLHKEDKRASRAARRYSAPAKKEEEEEPKEEIFEDEGEITLEIGSSKAKAADDEFDEFDGEFESAAAAVANVTANVLPPAAPKPDAAETPPEKEREDDRLALQRAAETAAAQAAAAKAAEEAAKAKEAEEAAAREKAERAAALKQIALQASGESTAAAAAPAPEPEVKSAAERADETYAATRGNFTAIAEDEEEEEEEEDDDVAASAASGLPPSKPTAGAEKTSAGGNGSSTSAIESTSEPAPPPPKPVQPAMSREERLMAQFEEATAAMDAAKAEVREANPDDDRKAKIHFKQATEELFAKMSTEALSGIVREDWESAPFLQRKFAFMRPKLNSPQLLETRDKILGLARTPMDRSVLHERILMSVYRVITREETLPPRFGPRWETVGFQGDDPATDLRGSGMLSLIQALHMAAKRPKLLQDIFKLSKGGADFPMMTVSINFTQVAMQALRGGVLTKEANSTKALLEAFHAMHAACFLYFIKEWKRRGLGIADFGFLKKEIETLAQKKPAKLLASLKAFDEGRSSQLDAIVESGKKKGEKEAKF